MSVRRYIGLFGFLLCGTSSFAQPSVRGQVESTTGEKLPFVHIINASQHTVVVSDRTGSFTIEAATGDTLDFSLVGYQPDRIIVKDEYYQQLL